MKKKIVIILLIVSIIILGFLSFIFIKNLRTEKDYVSEITKIGSEAYSEYYYKIMKVDKSDNDLVAYLKKYEISGLKFDLESLKGYAINTEKTEYYNLINEFLEKYKKCNENKSMVIIYPKEPYKNTDFKSEIKFNCELK